MRFCIAIGIILLVAAHGYGQANPQLNAYLLTSGDSQAQNAEERVDGLVNKLKAKRGRSERQLVGSVFSLTHRLLLKEYKQYSGFGEIFSHGRYDCLTATALYSLILDRLGFDYSIIETNYHIFLIVETDEGQVLIESTDPIDGFVDDRKQIEERLKSYREAGLSPDKPYYPSTFNLYQTVDARQLVGLLYFNQSVKAFNQRQWVEAFHLIKQTRIYYNSPRVDEMEALLAYAPAPGNYTVVQRQEE